MSCSDRSSYKESGFSSPDVQQERELFDVIKTYCSGRPNLLKRVVRWGLQVRKVHEPSVPINANMKSLKKITSGRLWVSCMFCDTHVTIGCHGEICPEQDRLDNMKGAYQEIVKGSGIYLQPKPKASQPGMQHRLRKEKDFWVIEEYDADRKDWILRAEESGRVWRDLKNPHILLKVKIIPLTMILQRMKNRLCERNFEKRVDFLFEICNQKKLNTKLRKRNFNHSIQSLVAKLEKQKCLSFAVRVRNVADSIAKEHGICC